MTKDEALRIVISGHSDDAQCMTAYAIVRDEIADLSAYGNYEDGLMAWLESNEFAPDDTFEAITIDWDDCVHDRLPCYRERDGDGWQCVNDHTGCVYNDGHNTCMHQHPFSLEPLETERLSDVEMYYENGRIFYEEMKHGT